MASSAKTSDSAIPLTPCQPTFTLTETSHTKSGDKTTFTIKGTFVSAENIETTFVCSPNLLGFLTLLAVSTASELNSESSRSLGEKAIEIANDLNLIEQIKQKHQDKKEAIFNQGLSSLLNKKTWKFKKSVTNPFDRTLSTVKKFQFINQVSTIAAEKAKENTHSLIKSQEDIHKFLKKRNEMLQYCYSEMMQSQAENINWGYINKFINEYCKIEYINSQYGAIDTIRLTIDFLRLQQNKFYFFDVNIKQSAAILADLNASIDINIKTRDVKFINKWIAILSQQNELIMKFKKGNNEAIIEATANFDLQSQNESKFSQRVIAMIYSSRQFRTQEKSCWAFENCNSTYKNFYNAHREHVQILNGAIEEAMMRREYDDAINLLYESIQFRTYFTLANNSYIHRFQSSKYDAGEFTKEINKIFANFDLLLLNYRYLSQSVYPEWEQNEKINVLKTAFIDNISCKFTSRLLFVHAKTDSICEIDEVTKNQHCDYCTMFNRVIAYLVALSNTHSALPDLNNLPTDRYVDCVNFISKLLNSEHLTNANRIGLCIELLNFDISKLKISNQYSSYTNYWKETKDQHFKKNIPHDHHLCIRYILMNFLHFFNLNGCIKTQLKTWNKKYTDKNEFDELDRILG